MSSERIVKDIRRATHKQYSAEEKIRIVLDGLRGEHSIAELCQREGFADCLLYLHLVEGFLKAGKQRLADDTARAATKARSRDCRREPRALKEPRRRAGRRHHAREPFPASQKRCIVWRR